MYQAQGQVGHDFALGYLRARMLQISMAEPQPSPGLPRVKAPAVKIVGARVRPKVMAAGAAVCS